LIQKVSTDKHKDRQRKIETDALPCKYHDSCPCWIL